MRPITCLSGSRSALYRCAQRALRHQGSSSCSSNQASRSLATSVRRSRKKFEKYASPQMGSQLPTSSGMDQPFAYSGDNIAEYSEKANLSPWVPVPDSVARKIFDRADVKSDDVHVELGSGDGRVNFFAIEAGVKQSTGIDVDEYIVKVASDRLNKIHPKPNLEFIVADLMDPNNPAWDKVKDATILTMYFAKDGLEKIRPWIEQALQGKRCRIFACGYPMPGWESQMVETVLDMPIHFYDWGNTEVDHAFVASDSILDQLPRSDYQPKDMDKFMKRKNTTFKPDPLLGFSNEDRVDNSWDDFDDDDDDESAKT
eukprot:CAMPEP_0117012094 /NCGR_PEP_ID=MMETSP0472-20121206/10256_1 /TAXON_ID=693140 ORGANISM="Tiarina fusus, Strain LIS" /NCGR_SAMPLE_ID=MMETSP0472 /ASSEMBLY_ACC=CAM_ASM_000603 /LENGTH=313 /DNA_ID=CAMNT_0004715083 /DNA_START=85 /DNA_END=1026 /DNA_ORIENTATION=+